MCSYFTIFCIRISSSLVLVPEKNQHQLPNRLIPSIDLQGLNRSFFRILFLRFNSEPKLTMASSQSGTSPQLCTSPNCGYDLGPHSITNTGSVNWDGKTEPLLQILKNEHITVKDKTGKTVSGPLMEVLAHSVKMECFGAKSPKVLTYPIVILDDDTTKHGFPEKVDDLQKHLDDSVNPMQEPAKKKVKKELDDWRKVVVGKLSENRVYDAMVAAAKEQGEECLVMASYSTDKFMGVIKEKGKNVRNGNVLSPFNRHERSVITALKMDVDPTKDVSGLLGSKTGIKPKDIDKEVHFNNISYKKVLKEMVHRVKKTHLDSNDLTHFIQYCKYSQQVQDAANEVDIICLFPRRKKILQIDTKSSTEDKNILGPLHTAAKQTKRLNELFSQWHGEILHGYTFYRAAAFPNVDTASKFIPKPPSKSRPPCSKCHEYILTWDKTEDIGKWMKTYIFCGPLSMENNPLEYKLLVTRIIGFISLAPVNNFYFHTEAEAINLMAKAITGEDSAIHGSASDAEATAALEELQQNCGFMGIQGKGQALGSLQVFITWNQQQLSNILRLNNMSWARFMVLVSDYGTGKSLLLKNLARAEAERILFGTVRPGRVFYISLGAAEHIIYDEAWQYDTVFDISTRQEFKNLKAATGINIEFRSTADILNEMIPDPKQRTGKTINQLLVLFFLKYRMDHHYGDEVPTEKSHSVYRFPSLVEGQDDVWSAAQGNIRLALRPVDYSGHIGNYSSDLSNYQSTLQTKYNVQFPHLDHRMRNSSKVAAFSDVVSCHKPGVTGSVPPYLNTVIGVTPKIVLTGHTSTNTQDDVFTTGVDYAIKNIIRNQPFVILTEHGDNVNKIYQHLFSSPSTYPVTVYNPGPDSHQYRHLYSGPCDIYGNFYHTDTQDAVRNYMQAPTGALLTTTRLFNGMEANNVIVAGSSSSDRDRCAVMRATVHPVYIENNVSYDIQKLCEVHRRYTFYPFYP